MEFESIDDMFKRFDKENVKGLAYEKAYAIFLNKRSAKKEIANYKKRNIHLRMKQHIHSGNYIVYALPETIANIPKKELRQVKTNGKV
jgi:hypothetical protein